MNEGIQTILPNSENEPKINFRAEHFYLLTENEGKDALVPQGSELLLNVPNVRDYLEAKDMEHEPQEVQEQTRLDRKELVLTAGLEEAANRADNNNAYTSVNIDPDWANARIDTYTGFENMAPQTLIEITEGPPSITIETLRTLLQKTSNGAGILIDDMPTFESMKNLLNLLDIQDVDQSLVPNFGIKIDHTTTKQLLAGDQNALQKVEQAIFNAMQGKGKFKWLVIEGSTNLTTFKELNRMIEETIQSIIEKKNVDINSNSNNQIPIIMGQFWKNETGG